MSFVAVAIGASAVIGAGTAIYEGDQNRKAISSEQNLLNNLQYQPIDIAQLQKQATDASVNDAINSLALQRKLQPNVVKSNDELSASVASQLALGGKLSPDTANQVAQAARTSTGASGSIGTAGPETAALIGQSSLGLLQQRQNAAETLSQLNPAPTVGLSAQDVASAVEANNNASNQFALAKAGGNASLIGAGAQNNAATAGGVSSSLTQALGLLALMNGGSTTSTGTPTLTPPQTANFSSTPLPGYGGSTITAAPSINPG